MGAPAPVEPAASDRTARCNGGWHDGAVNEPSERIAIPVVRDRRPKATTRCAVRLARRSGADIEYVATATPAIRDRVVDGLRQRCDEATSSGAPHATWRLLDTDDLDSYLSWSGAWCQCVGASARPSAIPLLVVGRQCRPAAGDFSAVVAGVDSSPGRAEHVAAVAASLADRIGALLTLIEVVGPSPADRRRPTVGPRVARRRRLAAAAPVVRHAAGWASGRWAAPRPRPVDHRRRRRRAWRRRPAGSPGAVPSPRGSGRLQHLGERVALLRVAGVVAPSEPRHALLGRPVREALLVDLLARPLLDGVVADRGRGVERFGDLALVEQVAFVRVRVPMPRRGSRPAARGRRSSCWRSAGPVAPAGAPWR